MLLSHLPTRGVANNGSLYFAHCARNCHQRQHNRCRDQNSSLTHQQTIASPIQDCSRMSLAKRDQFMKAIAHCLLFSSLLFLSGCGGGGSEEAPSVSSSSGQTGAIATLEWTPVQDPSIYGYYVHYGRSSSGQPGSCSYEAAQFVSSPSISIDNLDHNTRYYFAVSAYNGLESACSDEVSTITPAAQV